MHAEICNIVWYKKGRVFHVPWNTRGKARSHFTLLKLRAIHVPWIPRFQKCYSSLSRSFNVAKISSVILHISKQLQDWVSGKYK